MEKTSLWKAFWLAARPKTLPAAAVPVLVGGALAVAGGVFAGLPLLLCLGFAVLIQIGTNYHNDYEDHVRGTDDERRIGPARAVASGWVSARAMWWASVVSFVLALVVGCGLIPFGGWWLLPVGLVCIACGFAYTGGPYPLGYNGWGDLFVFVFFGWVATGLTYYVQAGTTAWAVAGGVWWIGAAGVVPGALSTNLLVVNNLRDQPLDAEAGKRTLAVRWGRGFAIWEYRTLLVLGTGMPLVFAVFGGQAGCWLVLASVPLAVRLWRRAGLAEGRKAYGALLGQTAGHLLLVGLLFALGLVMPVGG